MPTWPARFVFACFKKVERWGDRLTGFAGPYFVAFAVLLFVAGTASFLNVVLPNLPYPWITIPPCLLIIVNLYAHYYYVCTVSPGFASDPPAHTGHTFTWAKKHATRRRPKGVQWSSSLNITPAHVTKCAKCGETKPERTHHCRVCNRCVLKYDHHCPGINQCVGLHNERHFVLFMAYVVTATFWYAVSGFWHCLDALGINDDEWNYLVHPIIFAVTYMISVVMCLAVATMLLWHMWSVSVGETSVESQDHDVYRRMAESRGESFANSYDLGKLKNIQLFFNIGKEGYPWYTLVLPLRVPPYTDGRSWARRPGYVRHAGVRAGEELTDEED
ncbi:zf-DHHC-domain-containing protein [Auriscalpium vulgare]|uniref:Zf-DHHC-domain-containing protein n=1 Tax=Auriscalpium vulgare TaxID=40419 RepID=A0ACB8S203_9AGAM|nr:zf-DHHC-domain-containing protein [Auriscalpium vulgare]